MRENDEIDKDECLKVIDFKLEKAKRMLKDISIPLEEMDALEEASVKHDSMYINYGNEGLHMNLCDGMVYGINGGEPMESFRAVSLMVSLCRVLMGHLKMKEWSIEQEIREIEILVEDIT